MPAKFRAILPELERRDKDVHDLFIVACYLHACRTPVSFEVALGFMKLGTDINVVYGKIESLGALLSELGSPSSFALDDVQDYYQARSNIVADAVIEACTATPFSRVFDRFHHQISHYRIPRYNTFKRNGYNAEYALKAYADWEEGAEFYDRCYDIEENYYMLQQKAHYLVAKRRREEAFQAIEEAVQKSRGRSPRIRNTHAIVTFEANIPFAGNDPKVRKSLDQAMSILEDVKKDVKYRLAYHAFTYANQAIQYFEVYGDDKARQKLLLAREWLKGEAHNPIARRRVESMLIMVEKRL